MPDKIIPNKQQAVAIKEGVKWYKKGTSQLFVIAGYAGTGKTTIVSEIIRECGLKIHEAAYVAYVGKAAMVLSMKGLPARTIHSLIYECIDVVKRDEFGNVVKTPEGKLVFTKKFVLKKELPSNIKLIVVDEGSMVSDAILDDLMSFGKPVIILGDNHQLPPVFGISSCMRKPNVILTEIMRQAADNPIIHFATLARQQRWDDFKNGVYGHKVFIAPREEVFKSQKLIRNSNVIICAYNRTRELLNKYIREDIYGLPPDKLVIGDKLICRENCWDTQLEGHPDICLTNGTIGYVKYIDWEESSKRFISFDFSPEYKREAYFYGVTLDWKYLHQLNYSERQGYISEHTKFELGYAITCHLSQGSQYDNVLIYNETAHRGNDYSRWLYTAITRAVSKLIIAV